MKPKRPVKIFVAASSFLAWSCLGWLRLYATIKIWDLLTRTLTRPQPEYLVISAVCWGPAGLIYAYALFFHKSHARNAPIAAAGYALWYWIERVVLIQTESARANTFFAAAVSILWVAFVFWTYCSAKGSGYFNGPNKTLPADQAGGGMNPAVK